MGCNSPVAAGDSGAPPTTGLTELIPSPYSCCACPYRQVIIIRPPITMPLSSHPRGQHMTPAQFQAEHRAAKKARLERETANKRSTGTRDQDISAEINAIIDADAPVPALSHRQEDTWPHCPPDSARPRYTVEDFEIAYASHEQTKQWYRQFPAVSVSLKCCERS